MKIQVLITPRELDERGLWWEQALSLLAISPTAIADGKLDYDADLTLTQEQATRLGLLPFTMSRA